MKRLVIFSLALMGGHRLDARYYSQIGQDEIAQQLLNDKANGVFVDIGAYDGIRYSNTAFFEKERGWTGICVEPLPHIFPQLVQNRSCICVNGCIAPRAGREPFLKITNTCPNGPEMLSGLVDQYQKKHAERVVFEVTQNRAHADIIEVECFNFNDLMMTHSMTTIDFLSIDTEGGERRILESIDYSRIDINVITVENPYDDKGIELLLASKGFIHVKKVEWDDIYQHQKYYRTINQPNSAK